MGQSQLLRVGLERVRIRSSGFTCVVRQVQRIIFVQKEFIQNLSPFSVGLCGVVCELIKEFEAAHGRNGRERGLLVGV